DAERRSLPWSEGQADSPDFLPVDGRLVHYLAGDIARRGWSGAQQPPFGQIRDLLAAPRPVREGRLPGMSLLHPTHRVGQEKLRRHQVEVGWQLSLSFQKIIKSITF